MNQIITREIAGHQTVRITFPTDASLWEITELIERALLSCGFSQESVHAQIIEWGKELEEQK